MSFVRGRAVHRCAPELFRPTHRYIWLYSQILIMRHHFRNRNTTDFGFGFAAAAGNPIPSIKVSTKLWLRQKFCNGGAVSVSSHSPSSHRKLEPPKLGLIKQGKPIFRLHLHRKPTTLTKQQRIGNARRTPSEILVAGKLVIRQCSGKYPQQE